MHAVLSLVATVELILMLGMFEVGRVNHQHLLRRTREQKFRGVAALGLIQAT